MHGVVPAGSVAHTHHLGECDADGSGVRVSDIWLVGMVVCVRGRSTASLRRPTHPVGECDAEFTCGPSFGNWLVVLWLMVRVVSV